MARLWRQSASFEAARDAIDLVTSRRRIRLLPVRMSEVSVRLLPWRARPTAQTALVASSRRRYHPKAKVSWQKKPSARWLLSRLEATKKYPISVQLAAHGVRPDPWNSNLQHVRMRSQIVSPDLCGMSWSSQHRETLQLYRTDHAKQTMCSIT